MFTRCLIENNCKKIEVPQQTTSKELKSTKSTNFLPIHPSIVSPFPQCQAPRRFGPVPWPWYSNSAPPAIPWSATKHRPTAAVVVVPRAVGSDGDG